MQSQFCIFVTVLYFYFMHLSISMLNCPSCEQKNMCICFQVQVLCCCCCRNRLGHIVNSTWGNCWSVPGRSQCRSFLQLSHSGISVHPGQEFNEPGTLLCLPLLCFADGVWVMLKDRGTAERGPEIALLLLISGEFQFSLFLMPSVAS